LNPSYAARKHQRHFVFAALRETHELVVGPWAKLEHVSFAE
jgi:hypothetical protein